MQKVLCSIRRHKRGLFSFKLQSSIPHSLAAISASVLASAFCVGSQITALFDLLVRYLQLFMLNGSFLLLPPSRVLSRRSLVKPDISSISVNVPSCVSLTDEFLTPNNRFLTLDLFWYMNVNGQRHKSLILKKMGGYVVYSDALIISSILLVSLANGPKSGSVGSYSSCFTIN
ncbi:LAME_0C07250g1_1 [Lachancea meyersii CBS 8951]|uniref:LAME_0C07250g1_1 n=1 Tax=Lachancea meyersii CBS 8951 TaxID=1266667 RepID=A0A1G4J3A1_9SACH|nr:LAME_0C07250g1_1 [Lachancea meyersii CBS 8951]